MTVHCSKVLHRYIATKMKLLDQASKNRRGLFFVKFFFDILCQIREREIHQEGLTCMLQTKSNLYLHITGEKSQNSNYFELKATKMFYSLEPSRNVYSTLSRSKLFGFYVGSVETCL